MIVEHCHLNIFFSQTHWSDCIFMKDSKSDVFFSAWWINNVDFCTTAIVRWVWLLTQSDMGSILNWHAIRAGKEASWGYRCVEFMDDAEGKWLKRIQVFCWFYILIQVYRIANLFDAGKIKSEGRQMQVKHTSEASQTDASPKPFNIGLN